MNNIKNWMNMTFMTLENKRDVTTTEKNPYFRLGIWIDQESWFGKLIGSSAVAFATFRCIYLISETQNFVHQESHS